MSCNIFLQVFLTSRFQATIHGNDFIKQEFKTKVEIIRKEMNLITLHRRYSFIEYQNQVCSFAAFVTLLVLLTSIVLPFVWIYKINGNKFASSDDVIYEQPLTKFRYKYIVAAENSMDSTEKIVLCTSYSFLEQFNQTSEKCAKIKFVEKDTNYDGKIDEMIFTFEMHSMHQFGLKTISITLFLDTRLSDQCNMNVPSAVLINKKTLEKNFYDRVISITGSLHPVQKQPLVCPFFLRNVKSHFFFEKLNENQTNLEEYRVTQIRDNLQRNPLHFEFQESSTDLQNVESDKSTIKIKLTIPDVPVRYRKSFWKIVNDIWINYIAIFTVTFVSINFLLNLLFESRWLMARKKSYLRKSD